MFYGKLFCVFFVLSEMNDEFTVSVNRIVHLLSGSFVVKEIFYRRKLSKFVLSQQDYVHIYIDYSMIEIVL